jgi:hypothetical protein
MSAPAAPVGDGYLDRVSDESIQVLNHFGGEAPALLNRYACTVEDALVSQAQQTAQTLQQLQQLSAGFQQVEASLNAAMEDNRAYNLLVTDPDLLASYVDDYFGPNGVMPQILPEDRLAAEVAAGGYQNMPQPTYQRPQLEMRAPGVQQGVESAFWDQFQQVRPEDAWKLLASAPPEVLRARPLVSDQPLL